MPETPPELDGTGSSAGSAQPTPGVGPAVLACYDVSKSYGGVVAVEHRLPRHARGYALRHLIGGDVGMP